MGVGPLHGQQQQPHLRNSRGVSGGADLAQQRRRRDGGGGEAREHGPSSLEQVFE